MAAAFRHAAVPVLGLAGTLALTASPVYAEEKPSVHDPSEKKPIYTSPPPLLSPPPYVPTMPTPTDRLAEHIGVARRFINVHYRLLTRELDSTYSTYLEYEQRVASTIARLQPSGPETVFPGAIYVAITAMAGGIVLRRRMLPIRLLGTAAVGLGAAKALLPETTGNVGALIWDWEQRWPQVAEKHSEADKTVRETWRSARESVRSVEKMVGDAVARERQRLEALVKKG
ncbi:apolipo protein O-domain-containing protein [Geopyxis carbonaria]|nr:apolipo protein O-domain-containing protein [Geopyxis carbonaria]